MVNQQNVARVAIAALDRATDEVLTNVGADTGRWLRFQACLEHAEDFNDFHDAPSLIPSAQSADVTSTRIPGDVGNEAPAAFSAGASSGGVR